MQNLTAVVAPLRREPLTLVVRDKGLDHQAILMNVAVDRLMLWEEIKPNMLEKIEDVQQPLEQVLEEVILYNRQYIQPPLGIL
jgi:hypothetical protein